MSNLKKMTSLQSRINKRLGKLVDGDLFESMGNIKEYINSGNYMFNALFTGSIFDGIPDARIVELAGSAGSGKTFVCLNLAVRAIEQGYMVFYIETEGAIDDEDLIRFGLGEAMKDGLFMRIRKLDTFSKVTSTILAIADDKAEYMKEAKANSKTKDFSDVEELKQMIILDSYAQLITDKENDDLTSGKDVSDMGLRAKQGRRMFRNISLKLSNLNIPFVFTNQTSANMDMYASEKTSIGGGGGPEFGSSYVIEFSKRKLDADKAVDDVNRSGIRVKVGQRKNRKVAPHIFEMYIETKRGWNKYKGLEDFVCKKNSKGEPLAEFVDNSWDLFGLAIGEIYTEADFLVKFKDGIAVNSKKEPQKTHKYEKDGATYYCVENSSNRCKTIAVKDTCKTIPDMMKYLLTGHVFTHGTLAMLNENIIKPFFQFTAEEDESVQNALIKFESEEE